MSNVSPALFLDRDGVINYDYGYVSKIEEFDWIPGALETIVEFTRAGWLIFVVSNQAGIGKGYYSEDSVWLLHQQVLKYVRKAGGDITQFYYCPYHADATISKFRVANHFDRKPNPGLILKAQRSWNIDTTSSFLIGDRQTDVEAAEAAGIKGHLFNSNNLLEFVRELNLVPVNSNSVSNEEKLTEFKVV